MPRIPLYEPSQIQNAPLQTPRASNLPAGAFGEAIGKGLQDIGVVANKMQEEADTLRVEEELNKLREAQIDLTVGKDNGYQNALGKNVLDRESKQTLSEEYNTRLQARINELSTGLANDSQRQKFARRAGVIANEFRSGLTKHESDQIRAYSRQIDEGVVKVETENAARNFADPEAIALSLERIDAAVARSREREGTAGEKLIEIQRNVRSNVHRQVLEAALANDKVDYAKEYFDQNKSNMNQDDVLKAKSALDKGLVQQKVDEAVVMTWADLGPQSDTDPVNLDQMVRRVEELLKDDPVARKTAIATLKERASEFDYSVRQRENATAGALWKSVIDGSSIDQIRRSPEFKSLDGAKQAQLITSIESFRSNTGDSMTQYRKYWDLVSDPEKLAGMSDDAIYAMAGEVGNTLTKDLLAKKLALNNPAKIAEAKIDTDDFNMVALSAGLKPFDPKKSEKEKADLGTLKYAVEQRINVEQQQKKRALSRDEKMAIMRAEIDNKVMVDTWGRDKSKPAALLTPEEKENAYVVVNGQEVKVNAIPADSRAKIIRQMRANNIPVTEQGIAEVWVASRNRPSSRVDQIPQ
jgi:hypothetical protein